MKKTLLDKLTNNELEQLCRDYGITPPSTREAIMAELTESEPKPEPAPESEPKPEPELKPEPEPKAVAPSQGNMEMVTALEAQIKALNKEVAELRRHDVREIVPRLQKLEADRAEAEDDIKTAEGDVQTANDALRVANQRAADIDAELGSLRELIG